MGKLCPQVKGAFSIVNFFQTSNLFSMKKFLFVLTMLLCFGWQNGNALSAFLSGPEVVCPVPATSTYSVAGLTDAPGLVNVEKIRIRVLGTGNGVTAIGATPTSTCTQIAGNEVECVSTTSEVFALATASWVSPGSIVVNVFNSSGNIASSTLLNTSFDTSPGNIVLGGNSVINTLESFAYTAVTRPFSHTLTNTSWSISPTFGYTVTAPNPNERIFDFNTEGIYTITVTGTVTTTCGNTATRTTTRTITVSDDDAPIPFQEQDGPMLSAERKASSEDGLLGVELTELSPTQSHDLEITASVLSPNPVKVGQQMQIQLGSQFQQEMSTINIFNTQGQLVKTFVQRDAMADFSTAELSEGIYFLRISNSQDSETIQFVVTR